MPRINTTVGEILYYNFMEEEPGFETAAEIASKSGLDAAVIDGILDDRIRITPAISKRLAAVFDNIDDDNYWMEMQEVCDEINANGIKPV